MFEIKQSMYVAKETGGKHINGASIRSFDDEGNPLSDKCGRPLYEPANIEVADVIQRLMYVISDGETVRILSSKNLNRAFGTRQVKKAIRRFREKD